MKKKRTMGMYAMGGKVPVEVEGGESLQMPNGQYMQVSGPSHENGGVPAVLPEGTDVYSKRIAIDGKTMKQRKDAREKAINKMQKAVDRNPNPVKRRTLDRMLQISQMEEDKDMAIQKAAAGQTAQTQKFAAGGTVGSLPWAQIIGGAVDIIGQLAQGNQDNTVKNPLITEYAGLRPYATGGEVTGVLADDYGFSSSNLGYPFLGQTDFTYNPQGMVEGEAMPYAPTGSSIGGGGVLAGAMDTAEYNTLSSDSLAPNTKMGYTGGDLVGMAGNALGSLLPLLNTMNNRKGDTPNINAYKNFGKDALAANQKAQSYAEGIKNNQMEEARITRNSAKARNRNSASSVNTVRALDIATDMGWNNSVNTTNNSFAQQIMGLLGQQAGLENQQDQYVMAGEQQRDLADRQDRDAYFSNLGQNFNNLATGVQYQGQYMNQAKRRDDFTALLPELSKYGLGIVYDKNGDPVLSKVK